MTTIIQSVDSSTTINPFAANNDVYVLKQGVTVVGSTGRGIDSNLGGTL